MAEEIREVKSKNVMSAELAIQRELAYRKRVAKLSELYDGSTSMDSLKPLEVPSLNQKQWPSDKKTEPKRSMNSRAHQQPVQTPSFNPFRPLSFPSANPNPTSIKPLLLQKSRVYQGSSFSGSKRKESSHGKEYKDEICKRVEDEEEEEKTKPKVSLKSSAHRQPIQTPSLNPFRPLSIPIANPTPNKLLVYQNSGVHQGSGVLGSKRKESSNGVEYKDEIFNGNGRVEDEGEEEKTLFCEICQVHCSAEFNMKQHLVGQKHKANVVLAKQGGGMEKKRQWDCQVCEIYCSSEELLNMHIQGKKHKLLELSLQRNEVKKRAKYANAAL